MKALPVIIAVVVVAALVRLGLRRRGRGPLGDTGLVAGREIRERVRGRLFWVGPSSEPGTAAERAPGLRLHRLPHWCELRHPLTAGEGTRLRAPHRPIRHADLDRVRGRNLVAVPAVSGGDPDVHARRGVCGGPGIRGGRTANR